MFNLTSPNATPCCSGPITTGSSVIGLKFDGGVIIAADTLVSYGSMARFRNIDRVFKVSPEEGSGICDENEKLQLNATGAKS